MAYVNKGGVALVWLFGFTLTAAGSSRGEDQDPSAFLAKLAGAWSVVSEATLGPGRESIRQESVEVARLLGENWIVAETSGSAPSGAPVTSILILGYDPFDEQFVATFVSSMQTHLWSYTGKLDDSGTTLTLETEGPILGDPTRTARYREVLRITNTDRKVMRSMILGPDGEWFEFARAEYQRTQREPALNPD